MARSVTESWAVIDDWLRQHLPHIHAMLAPPATPAELRAVEEAHGVDLPDDLAAWWRGANGMAPGRAMSYAEIVPPGLHATSTRLAIKHLHETREIATDATMSDRHHHDAADEEAFAREYDDFVAQLMRAPAGTPGPDSAERTVHLPAWILFAWSSGGYFIDCRSGPRHGCVMRQESVAGWSGPLWPSVAAMWEETSDVLTGLDVVARPDRVQTTVGEWWFPGSWWPEPQQLPRGRS